MLKKFPKVVKEFPKIVKKFPRNSAVNQNEAKYPIVNQN